MIFASVSSEFGAFPDIGRVLRVLAEQSVFRHVEHERLLQRTLQKVPDQPELYGQRARR